MAVEWSWESSRAKSILEELTLPPSPRLSRGAGFGQKPEARGREGTPQYPGCTNNGGEVWVTAGTPALTLRHRGVFKLQQAPDLCFLGRDPLRLDSDGPVGLSSEYHIQRAENAQLGPCLPGYPTSTRARPL